MVKSKGTSARKPARETRVCATVLLAVARAIAKTRRTTAKFFMDCLPFRGMGPVAAAGTGARHTSGFTVEGSGERGFAPPQQVCKQIVTSARSRAMHRRGVCRHEPFVLRGSPKVGLPGELIRLFQLQQLLLSPHAPTIPPEAAVLAHHTVAGDLEGHRIRCAGASNGARSRGPPDGAGNLAVRFGHAAGDGLEVTPDLTLEGRGLNIQRQCGVELVPIEVLQHLLIPALQVVILPFACREGVLAPEAKFEI